MAFKNNEAKKAYHATYIRNHYQQNKEYYKAKARSSKERIRLYIRQLKDKPCSDCNLKYPYYVMDFDHRPEFQKSYMINQMHVYSSQKKVDEEVAKCDVVCSNCHRIRTYKRLEEQKESKKRRPRSSAGLEQVPSNHC